MELLPAVLCFGLALLPGLIAIAVFRAAVYPMDLSRMAGWLSLKPYVDIPLWLLIVAVLRPTSTIGMLLTFIPAIVVTGIIVRVYAHVWLTPQQAWSATMLVVLDVARWITTFLLTAPSVLPFVERPSVNFVNNAALWFNLAFPVLYPLIALRLITIAVRWDKKGKDKGKDKNDDLN